MVTGALTSHLSGESPASVSTGVLKEEEFGVQAGIQRARKGFLCLPRCLLSFWVGRGAVKRGCPSSSWWGFFSYSRKLVSVVCMALEGKKNP